MAENVTIGISKAKAVKKCPLCGRFAKGFHHCPWRLRAPTKKQEAAIIAEVKKLLE